MNWNPNEYLKFSAERFRAAVDLMAQIPLTACQRAYDLGCGTGHITRMLLDRWPGASVTGVDASPEMLERARAEFPQMEWVEADISRWHAPEPPDLILSNAALHWVPGHQQLFPGLLGQLKPGGILAIQMPRLLKDPFRVSLLETASDSRWSEKVSHLNGQIVTHAPEDYWNWLAPHAARVDIWETTYVHALEGENPVLEWLRGTSLRPYLQALGAEASAAFVNALAPKLLRSYPQQPGGKTLLPFRRIFLIAQR